MDENSVQKVAAVDTKNLQGINISGYKYSYRFLSLALAGAGLGLFVAFHFKQNWIGYLALSSAGFLGASSVALKVYPPVRDTRNK
jgi:hypothetical protein